MTTSLGVIVLAKDVGGLPYIKYAVQTCAALVTNFVVDTVTIKDADEPSGIFLPKDLAVYCIPIEGQDKLILALVS
jgi:hypothetical protein